MNVHEVATPSNQPGSLSGIERGDARRRPRSPAHSAKSDRICSADRRPVADNSSTRPPALVRAPRRRSRARRGVVADSAAVAQTADILRHADVIRAWLAARAPLVLCGPPGSGKTMTANAVARKMSPNVFESIAHSVTLFDFANTDAERIGSFGFNNATSPNVCPLPISFLFITFTFLSPLVDWSIAAASSIFKSSSLLIYILKI